MQIEYTAADIVTFWSRVDKNGPVIRPELGSCWIWTRAKSVSGGYGIFGPSWKRVYRAHRFAWTITNGPIPAGIMLCHACDNPPCVRPDHLTPATQKFNMRECVDRGRNRVPTEQRGAAHHSAKLTEDQVREIRRRAANGEQQRSLSREYGVTEAVASAIVRRRIWKHVL